ncbi:MAG: AAA family ATPase [Oscillospiraceae bacterium]|nr:AAA family ATPase [Oscillospiraceae bacterium]
MEILNISVGGFRNISSTSLDFGRISALVGLNGLGKSNIVDAIGFGLDFVKAPSQYKSMLMASKNNIPILKTNAGKGFSFSIETKLSSGNGSFFALYEFTFAWNTDRSGARILTETLKIKREDKNQKYNLFISRKGREASYKPSETSRCSKVIKIEDNSLVLNKLRAIDNLFYSDIIDQLNNIGFFVERHLDASASYIPAPFVVRGFKELELEGIQSIPRAIFFLKKDFERQYNLLINAFKILFPSIDDVIVDEIKLNRDNNAALLDNSPIVFADCIYSLSVIDNRLIQPLRFEGLSDGTKRIFLMLTFAVIADIRGLSLIAIEEPENSIHPVLLQNYMDILSQLVNGCKIIVTSHSPYIIQYLDPHNVFIAFCNDDGETEFKRIAASKVPALLKDATEYDKSVGDYIFNLLSGSDAYEALQEYIG